MMKQSFLRLEIRVAFHDAFQVLISERVKSGKIVFIVNHSGIWVFIGSKFNEIVGLFCSKFDTRSFQMPSHLFNFNAALALRI